MLKIANDPNLPALASSISQVVQMASSGDDAVRDLARFVLSDASLTQKILRLANTVTYRVTASGQVTTISRAIFVLGFDAVKTTALAILLVDGMTGKHAVDVRAELSHAMCASIVGRELARRSHFKDAEEAAVAALFKNMGRLLVAAHDHQLYKSIIGLMETDGSSPANASMARLGCSFETLAESVLYEWKIPDSIVKALAPLPPGLVKAAKSRHEWMQQVAVFSTMAATLIPQMSQPGEDAASRVLLARFGTALGLDQPTLTTLLASVIEQASVLSAFDTASTADSALAAADDDATMLPTELLMRVEPELDMSVDTCHPSGKPMNSRELLMTGVRDVTEMMASGRSRPNDVALLVLETLHHSLGLRFSTICVRDSKSGQFKARLSLGEKNTARQAGFGFTTEAGRDLFALALKNDADLMIADAMVPTIAVLIPVWHRGLLPDARSFIVLPLLIQGKSFGLFYGDRIYPSPEGVPTDETALIKMLKGLLISALVPR
ncbi:HDOD domain-containing protein [Actimicrobium antarcticum]|uniref:HDOD domain-containing protein n=1 Tax=Actimicrobium antarcticum TaxID=1051899 RepID=A0ABP7SVI5_9BURK